MSSQYVSSLVSFQVVANCHKLPSSCFTRRLLRVDEIVEGLVRTIEQLHEVNPEVSVALTVSPVRHWKDGPGRYRHSNDPPFIFKAMILGYVLQCNAVQNSRSKAILLTSVHEVVESLPSSVTYFPAYEIVMDELRYHT